VNRNASNIGRRFNNAVSEVSENHDFIGIALSEKQTENRYYFVCHPMNADWELFFFKLPGNARYAAGELSRINTLDRSFETDVRSLV